MSEDLESWRKEIRKIPGLIEEKLKLAQKRYDEYMVLADNYEKDEFLRRAKELREEAKKNLTGGEEWRKLYEDRLGLLKGLIEEAEKNM